MKKINISINCPNSKEKHDFSLSILDTLDVLFKCSKCNYQYIDVVDKPQWLLDQKDDILKNHKKNTNK